MKKWLSSCLVWLYVILTLFPILWIFSISVKPKELLSQLPPVFFFVPTFQSFISLFTDHAFMPILLNSLIISFSTLLVSLFIGTIAAYSLARYQTGGKTLSFSILVIQMIPPMVITFPLYILIQRLGLIDTKTGLVLAQLTFTLPFIIWIMRQFFSTITIEIEEAAKIDGASDTKIIFWIMIPIAMPGLVSASIFTFLRSWNDFLYPLILTLRHAQTVTVSASKFVTIQDVLWSEIGAVSSIIILPPILLTIILRRRIVAGLVGDSTKG